MKNHKNTYNELVEQGINVVDKELKFFTYRANLRKFMSKEDIEDMRGEALILMLEVIERYDSTRGATFSTFLTHRVKGFFKDYLRKQQKYQKIRLDSTSKSITEEIHKVMVMDNESIVLKLKQLDVKEEIFKNILIDVGSLDIEFLSTLYDIILTLPDIRSYILLSYYMMDKGIIEIANELGMSPTSGWIYRIKKQSIEYIKKELEKKMKG